MTNREIMVTARVTQEQSEYLRRRSQEHEISKAEYVRRLIEEDMIGNCDD